MPDSTQKPYHLGIALSGGGARGFAHVGALKALEEHGMRPDVIAGVSAGSVVAVLYAAGVSIDKMMSIFSDMKFRDFCEFTVRGGGFFKIDKFRRYIQHIIGDRYSNLEDLDIPTYIGVTDFDNGRPVEFHTGPICDIMTASCSIPILFQPVEINGTRYVDGGVMKNMPSWILRDKCETLIGVNCSPFVNRKTKNSIFEVGMRTYNIMAKANQREDMKLCDIAVEIPEIATYKVFNLKHINQVYIRGYAATKKLIKEWESKDLHPSNITL